MEVASQSQETCPQVCWPICMNALGLRMQLPSLKTTTDAMCEPRFIRNAAAYLWRDKAV